MDDALGRSVPTGDDGADRRVGQAAGKRRHVGGDHPHPVGQRESVHRRLTWSVRVVRRSASTNDRSGRRQAMTSPGTPPPVPRSTTVAVTPPARRRTPRCAPRRRQPAGARIPRRCESASAASSGRRRARPRRQAGLTMIRRFGSSPSDRLVTPSIAVERVVNHLAVRRRHRVERAGDPDSLTMSATPRANRSRATRRFSR